MQRIKKRKKVRTANIVATSKVYLARISHEFFGFRLKFLIFIENTVALKKQTVFSSIIKKLTLRVSGFFRRLFVAGHLR